MYKLDFSFSFLFLYSYDDAVCGGFYDDVYGDDVYGFFMMLF